MEYKCYKYLEKIKKIGGAFSLQPLKIKLDYDHSVKIIHDDSILIEESTIPFTDLRPYHLIDMYKKMVIYYIGIFSRVSIINSNGRTVNPFIPSYPKVSEVDTETYIKCRSGKNDLILPDQQEQQFEHVGIYNNNGKHYLSSSNLPINVIRKNNTVFICFDTGYRDYETLKTIDKMYFFSFFNELKYLLSEIKQIVLCGHSNGMTTATATAFILLWLSDDHFRANNGISGSDLDVLAEHRDKFKYLSEKSIFVVGTGGSPILFDTQEKFKFFFDKLKGRYVHILSGIYSDRSYIDYYGSTLAELNTYRFGHYFYCIKDETKKQLKYSGTQCYLQIFNNSAIVVKYPWNLKKEVSRMNEYNNTVTKQITYKVPTEIKNLPENKGYNFIDCNNDDDIENLKKFDSSLSCKQIVNDIHQFSLYRKLLVIYFFN